MEYLEKIEDEMNQEERDMLKEMARDHMKLLEIDGVFRHFETGNLREEDFRRKMIEIF